jgi:hypothetical protein
MRKFRSALDLERHSNAREPVLQMWIAQQIESMAPAHQAEPSLI